MGTQTSGKFGGWFPVWPQSLSRNPAFLLAGGRWRTRRFTSRRSRKENSQSPQRTPPPGAAMILPYLLRLLCLCFASFFVLNAAAGLFVRISSKSAIRFAQSRTSSTAAQLLLALRLLPFALAALFVASLC